MPRLSSGAGDGALARGDALRKRRIGLVGKAVIVLDDIDAVARQRVGQACKCLAGQALRLEGGAGQCPTSGLQLAADAVDAKTRPGEASQELGRKFDVHEL